MTFALYVKVLQALEREFPPMSACVDAPVLTTRHGLPAFRYEKQSLEQALVQKAARVVSGLHASLLLLHAGHLQELRAIYRMLDEFGEDIVFLGDVIVSGQLGDLHKEYLDDFWAEEFDVEGKPFQSRQKRKRVRRAKIQAAIARQSVFPMNPSDGQRIHETLAKTYAGYVHGASPHIMEMYGGQPGRFHTSGMLGTPPFEFAIREAANYFYRGLLNVLYVAMLLRCAQAEGSLREIKNHFESVTGAGLGEVEAKIRMLKK